MPSLSELSAKYKKKLATIPRIACAAVSHKVIMGTPVLSGSARASWTPSKGAPVVNIVNIDGENPTPERSDITKIANSLQPGDTYNLVNAQPYIRRLEYEGYSAKAPNGMLRIAVASWDSIVEEASKSV